MHSQPLVRKTREAEVDYANIDPASQEARSESIDGWFSRREKKSQILPRVETYAFDPYSQAKPFLYTFQRDSLEPRIFFRQTRTDGRSVGVLQATAAGDQPGFVSQIDWHRHGGADFEFKMIGTNRNLPPLAEGYCKKTDLDGKLRWVAVVTSLHGKDLPATQGMQLFSMPLFEAVATAVAYGLFDDDRNIRLTYPDLGTQSALERSAADKTVVKPKAVEQAAATPLPGFTTRRIAGAEGTALELQPGSGASLGAIFPLRGNRSESNGRSIDRLVVRSVPVTFGDHPEVRDIKKYEVAVFSREHEDGDRPTAMLSVAPIAMESPEGKLELKYFIAKPMLDEDWCTSQGMHEVDTDDVESALSELPGWSAELRVAIDAAMHALDA